MGVAARKFLFFGLEDVSLISLFFWVGWGWGLGRALEGFLELSRKGFSPVFGGFFRERRGENL